MATLQIATPFAESNAYRKRASITGMQGFGGRKALRVSCHHSVPAGVEGYKSGSESDGSQEAVSILQSSRNPLLNLPREDLIAALAEKENRADAHGVVAPAADHLNPEPVNRRRSERVIFTEEKARLLRNVNRATTTFHDKWYHSAIASKLASPE